VTEDADGATYHHSMEPSPPLILLEAAEGPQEGPPRGGDPRLVGSVDELIGAVEAPDIRAGIVHAFDAAGHRLRLQADGDTGPITATLLPGEYPDELRDTLAAAIRSSPHLYPFIDPGSALAGLVAALWRQELATRADRRNKRLARYKQIGLWLVLMAAIVVARPAVLQPRADMATPILLGLWLVVALGTYWLAGRLLALYDSSSIPSSPR
jgi:hypothetical protein